MATVTALRALPRERVEVELDGAPWRVLPSVAVVRCGLAVGRELDRPLARELRHELRRAEALVVAARSLRSRDRSAHEVEARLDRRGVRADARRAALETLAGAGLVDDGRFARGRAATLAARGWGDAAIHADLEGRGIAEAVVAAALAELEPESDRAAAVVAREGATVRTLRRLAARGFATEALEEIIAPEGW